jgi:hypothetical protein
MDSDKLGRHHQNTVEKIFAHPTSHNIAWHDALSLLQQVGTVIEEDNHRFTITVGDETQSFDRPKGDDIDQQQIVDVRRMLRNAGFVPAA